MEAFNVQNIIQGDGIAISLTGMAIVFSGLIIMSFFIKMLPKILQLLEKKPEAEAPSVEKIEAPEAKLEAEKAPVAAAAAAADGDDDKDIASVIGLILHLENERHYQSDNQFITINREMTQQSKWGRTGQLRSTPHRRSYAKV